MSWLRNVVFKATQGNTPFQYLSVTESGRNKSYLGYSADEVFNKNGKFKVENAQGDLVHILSCSTNRYLTRLSNDQDWIVAKATKPEVDKTSWACTLFRMDISDDKKVTFYHVQSDSMVRILGDGNGTDVKQFLTISSISKTIAVSLAIDYDDFVILPKYVAFKGSNGLFYQTDKDEETGNEYLCRFYVKDVADPKIVCETRYTSDGNVRLRPVNTRNGSIIFWTLLKRFNNVIGYEPDNPKDVQQQFSVVRVRDGVVALRSLGNNKFCRRTDIFAFGENRPDRLVANADGAVADTHLEVVEAVIKRTVYGVEFDLDSARIYGLTLLYSDEHVWKNPTDEKQAGKAEGRIKTSKTKTYTNNVTVSTSVKTTFETGIPFIAKGEISVSASASYTHEWSETTSEEQEVGHSFDVVVLPKKKTTARGTATRAFCDVPFRYIQKDYPSTGGPPIVTKLSDGVFKGANAYGFNSEILYEDLTPEELSPGRIKFSLRGAKMPIPLDLHSCGK